MPAQDSAPPPHAPLNERAIRERIADQLWGGLALPALLGMPASLLRVQDTGWMPVYGLHVGISLLTFVIFLTRRRLPLGVKAGAATLLLFLLGVGGIFSYGFYGGALVWFTLSAVVAAIFFSWKVVASVVAGQSLTLSGAAVGFTQRWLTLPVNTHDYIHQASAWAGVLVAVVIALGVVILCITSFRQSLATLLQTVQSQQNLIEHQATHDALTGLPNLRLGRARLQQACARAQRHGGCVGVFYVDLDGFKAANDTHGHAAGDHLLACLAQRLREALRASDTPVRQGGDEFVVVVEDLPNPASAQAVADKLIQTLSAPVAWNNAELQVGASIGIALCPEHGAHPDALLQQADGALYAAKRGGKNRWVMATP